MIMVEFMNTIPSGSINVKCIYMYMHVHTLYMYMCTVMHFIVYLYFM